MSKEGRRKNRGACGRGRCRERVDSGDLKGGRCNGEGVCIIIIIIIIMVTIIIILIVGWGLRVCEIVWNSEVLQHCFFNVNHLQSIGCFSPSPPPFFSFFISSPIPSLPPLSLSLPSLLPQKFFSTTALIFFRRCSTLESSLHSKTSLWLRMTRLFWFV